MKPNLIKQAHYEERTASGNAFNTVIFSSGIAHDAKSLVVKIREGYNQWLPGHIESPTTFDGRGVTHVSVSLNDETYGTSWLPNAEAINLDGEEVYGGSIDLASGVLTVTHTRIKLKVSDMNSSKTNYPNPGDIIVGWRFDNHEIRSIVGEDVKEYVSGFTNIGMSVDGYYVETDVETRDFEGVHDYIMLPTVDGMTIWDWKNTYPDLTVEVILKYGTPVVYNLSPIKLPVLLGSNQYNVINDQTFDQYSPLSTITYYNDFVSTERLGTLTDSIKCVVAEELNGGFELELTYPIDGIHATELSLDSVIEAKPNDISSPQLFRIYKVDKPINGRVTYNAEHISYWLMHIPCLPFYAEDLTSAFSGLKTNALEDCPFTFWSDKNTVATYIQTEPASIRSRLGGVEGSILDTYRGEYEWDNYTVKLHQHRGSDKGVTLRYGKNITDLTAGASIENTVTGVTPYWIDDEEGVIVMLPENTVYSANADAYPFKRTIALDVSSEFEVEPTEEELRAYATKYLSQDGRSEPSSNIKVSFVALWNTPEYASIAPLEKVGLGDTVHVYYEKLGVTGTSKVIKTKYDCLKERYESIELGSVKSNLNKTISDIVSTETGDDVTTNDLQKAIDGATSKLLGTNGGYKIDILNADGQIIETRYVDSLDPSAVDTYCVWNVNGFGYFSNGDLLRTAITNDGKIVADSIMTGTLNAGLIKAGVISNNAEHPTDADNYWDLDTGNVKISFGSVKDSNGVDVGTAIQNGVTSANEYADNAAGVVSGRVSDLANDLAASNDMISSLGESVNVVRQQIRTDNDGLHVSAADSENSKAEIVITNERVSFQYGGNEVGYINQDGFNLANGVLTNTLTIGSHWVWTEDKGNNHLRLVYNP